MLGWLTRPILFLSGILAGIFIAEDDLHHEVVKLVIALMLMVLAIAAAAFWKRGRQSDD